MSIPEKPPTQLTSVVGDTFTNDQIDALYDIIVAGPKQQNPTMRESTFRTHFLPVLAGVVDDPEILRVYMQGAAGFNVGLNVVDDAGNFLFEVPPIYGSDHIKVLPEEADMPTFGTIVEHVHLMRYRSPAKSKEMFRTGILHRMLLAHRKGYLPTANEKKWIAIFKRYGYDVQATTLTKEQYDAITNAHSNGNAAVQSTAPGAPDTPEAKPGSDFEIIGEF